MGEAIKYQDPDVLREKILEAARERFSTYGYNKTTMAEIARDCACSAANLYRYFESKQEIMAAVCQGCMHERTVAQREAVRRPRTTAAERFREFVFVGLESSRERADNSPKLNELVAQVLEKRQDLVHHRIREQCSLIAEVLANGNETGEFAVDDVITTARSICAALALFEVPIFQSLFSEAEFKKLADGTVDLLLQGILKRDT